MPPPVTASKVLRRFLVETDLKEECISKYVIRGRIGSGGMADVFEAYDPDLRRAVALKILRPRRPGDARRFLREARIAAGLQHPGIVPVHDAGTVKNAEGAEIHYIAMALVPGRTLADVLQGPQDPGLDLLVLLESVARAVEHAHSQGVIHRDLKPANILIDLNGEPRLTDFGIARARDLTILPNQPIEIRGTAHYMAPEQVRGEHRAITPRTDVYALGVLLFQCLTGKLPFDGRTIEEVHHRILHTQAPGPSDVGTGICPDLEAICRKAMAADPAQRYASAREFADDLRLARSGRTIRLQPPGVLRLTLRRLRRPKVQAACLLGVAVVLLAGLAFVWTQWSRARSDADAATFLLLKVADDALEAGGAAQIAGDTAAAERAWARLSETCDRLEVSRPVEAAQLRDRMRRLQTGIEAAVGR